MLIDTHAHLNLTPLVCRWQDYVLNSLNAGVERVVIPGTDIESSLKAVEMAEASSHLVAAVGLHPTNISSLTKQSELELELASLRQMALNHEVVAVGEIGLDYQASPDDDIISLQRWLFRQQLQIAKDNHKAVLVHTRRSQAIYDACNDIAAVYLNQDFRGVFHCFTGSKRHYECIRQVGGYVGVGGFLTYAHNGSLRKTIQSIPMDKIVLETDAPWNVPLPKVDSHNQPALLVFTALKLAETLSLPLSTVIMTTTRNALELIYGKPYQSLD